MTFPMLLISENPKDIEFWQGIAESVKRPLTRTSDSAEIEKFLEQNPNTVVLWDAKVDPASPIEAMLMRKTKTSKVFAITEEPIKNQPNLCDPPLFAHHLLRRYEDPASKLFAKLVLTVGHGAPLTLKDFFPSDAKEHKIEITSAAQKNDVLEGLRVFLSGQNVMDRMVTSGIAAADELLMNAVFDAPYSEQHGHYRRKIQRSTHFDLTEKEKVDLAAYVSPELVGIRVADNFGSVDGEKVIKKLAYNFTSTSYEAPKDDPGAGLGLYMINQAAMTLLLVIEPGKKTEGIVLFANKNSYRDLKLGFRFFSVLKKD